MPRNGRRRVLQSIGAAITAGVAGCSGGDGSGDGGNGDGGSGGDGTGDGATTSGASSDDLVTVRTKLPEGTIQYPWGEASVENGFYEEQGIDMQIEYVPFNSQVQSLTNGDIDVGLMSMLPYIGHYNRGEDLVTFGWNGSLQSVNALYTRADSDYETIDDLSGNRLGVWSWGSSTVQSFQAVIADETGHRLREDFQTTTAAPPALTGLLDDGEVDGIINVSGLTIAMEAQPDKYRSIRQLNAMWQERTGQTLPLTSWWCYSDWYQENQDVAAGLMAGARNSVQYWRENTVDILEEYGEAAGIDSQAKIDVVDQWTNDGQVFRDETTDEYLEATWEFVDLMGSYDFVDEVPSRDSLVKHPQ